MARDVTNVAASVHQRLLNRAKESGRPFNELLQHFAIERFIYRLSRSPLSDSFVLKGASMLSVWSGPSTRPTRDIDLLGKLDNSVESISAAMKEVCGTAVEGDGMVFDEASVRAVTITEGAEYAGVRVRLDAALGNARVPIQVDVATGDVVVPGPREVEYPTLLDFPAPRLRGYTMESTIAEKFQAMVVLDLLNSRMKDFYDVWMLSRTQDFAGPVLAEAIVTTFESRGTQLTPDPTVFERSFADDSEKEIQWTAFVRKTKLSDAPEDFAGVAAGVTSFLRPPVLALTEGRAFGGSWKAPGPWK